MPEKAAIVLRNRQPGHDKFYVCRVDYIGGDTPYRVTAAWGPAARPKAQSEQPKKEFATFRQAENLMGTLVRKKMREGYEDVATWPSGHVNRPLLLEKVDMTRCCNDDGSVDVAMVSTTTTRLSAATPRSRTVADYAAPTRRKITRLEKKE